MTDGFDELSARARRGELSRGESQRLSSHLKASAEARVWHDAGRELDAEDAVLPGDHEAALRVVKRTLAAWPAPRRRYRPRALLLVACLLVVSAASAAVGGWHYVARRDAVKAQFAQGTALSVAPRRAAPAVARSISVSAPPTVETSPLAVGAAAPSVTPPSDSAAELLRAASLARRQGNGARAIALLDGLTQRFPASREARLADMTLGSLHQQRAESSAALQHFRRYLRHSPGGELASEALWGEAQALLALGQTAEARRSLQLLLARFPGSAYAAAARAKLQAP